MLVVELMRNVRQNPSGNNNIVADCREGMSKIPRIHIQHCYREANKCADALARRGAFLSCDFFVFDALPIDVALLLSLDAAGMMYERSIATASGF
ncbi:hypothetical protein SO802_028384 [Lithocarpus litseifolius]|uniref:RNase H type-1 domain-containing protein n=1 Tax=Lithocarpus litseifolius TaxID=425828 RepID=A0AAW2BQ62_9ROSI